MKFRPTGVKADRNGRELIINWNDGHVSHLPFAGLRAVCPCVDCKGGHANMGGPPDPRIVRDTKNAELNITQIQPAGSYALQIHWSDGHWTGIYTWEMLRLADPAFLKDDNRE